MGAAGKPLSHPADQVKAYYPAGGHFGNNY